MLLLPVLIDGAGVRTVYQTKTPWAAAWLRFRDAASALDYVIPAASAGDNVVLTAFQARRSDRTLWRTVLARFKADDVLTAEIRLIRTWPGGPVTAIAVARHGPDAVELGRVALRAASPAGVDAMLDEAVRAVDAIYVRALANGQLQRREGADGRARAAASAPVRRSASSGAGAAGIAATEADVATPDAAGWTATVADLRATPGVTDVRLLRLSLGAVSRIVIHHSDSDASARLPPRPARLAACPAASGVLLRRKVAGDPVVPPPPTATDGNTEMIAEPDAAPLTPTARPDSGGAGDAPGGATARSARAELGGAAAAAARVSAGDRGGRLRPCRRQRRCGRVARGTAARRGHCSSGRRGRARRISAGCSRPSTARR